MDPYTFELEYERPNDPFQQPNTQTALTGGRLAGRCQLDVDSSDLYISGSEDLKDWLRGQGRDEFLHADLHSPPSSKGFREQRVG